MQKTEESTKMVGAIIKLTQLQPSLRLKRVVDT